MSIESVGRLNNTPLLWASFFGQNDIAVFLLLQGANKYAVNSDGKTALMLAIERGHRNVQLTLQAAGAPLYTP